MRPRWWILAAAVAAFVLGACSDDDAASPDDTGLPDSDGDDETGEGRPQPYTLSVSEARIRFAMTRLLARRLAPGI